MNFDRNTVIGFVVLALLFFGYFYYTNQEQQAYQKEKARLDSIARAKQPKTNPTQIARDSNRLDAQRLQEAGGFGHVTAGTETIIPVENEVMRVGFTNKGGQPKWVELKGFKAPDSSTVKLAASEFDKFTYSVNAGNNRTVDITNLYFTGGQITKDANGNQVVTFQAQAPQGTLIHQYVIKANNYMIDFNLGVNGVNNLLAQNTINFTWQNRAVQLQKDLKYEKQQSTISFRTDGDYDDASAFSSDTETFNDPVNWVAVKQQFFNSAFVAKNNTFSSGNIQWASPEKGNIVVDATANLKLQLPAQPNATANLGLYYGPTDYKILKQYGNDMEDMVNLGTGVFAFVKYINRWIVIPVFDVFKQFTSNFGIVILLLTLFIRLLISPLTYSSYLSGAKMKVLRPEIDQLKAKHGGDQQAMSMDQMKLFREAGVNPLGGCIPALLQIPIFFALYSFFNSNVDLRGKNFLWAEDLSQYDSIATLPFNIPFYGDHVSLFTITAIITSLAISLYSMSSMPDQGNPVMKYMPYIFPVILLFVFNTLPAGLTWYYTVSNIITLVLQFIIQNYIINHDKILAKMEENRKKPKTKSKWQERMEQMQDQQRKMQEMQQRNKK
jgi:YidC/Oxa1 family membrane protein insertase